MNLGTASAHSADAVPIAAADAASTVAATAHAAPRDLSPQQNAVRAVAEKVAGESLMKKISANMLKVLNDIRRGINPYFDCSRTIKALIKRRFLNDKLEITEAGKEMLAAERKAADMSLWRQWQQS